MTWRMAKSLGSKSDEGLLGEINESAPNRSKASDGGIGDANHSSRTSDHNPCSCHRVVCARDFTHDPKGGFDANEFAKWLSERVIKVEPRVKYIIWNRQICSGQGQSYPAGVWRAYSGSNAHTKHVHVSVRHPEGLFDFTATWGWVAKTPAPPPKPTALAEPAWPIPAQYPAAVPTYPLPAGHWFGPESSNKKNHSGYASADRPYIRYLVLLLQQRGWQNVVDADRYTKPFAEQIRSFQLKEGLTDDGLTGTQTFAKLHTAKLV